MQKKDRKLERLRAQIESVDKVIIKSLSMRIKLVQAVGRYKLAHKISFLDKNRRDALLKMWMTAGKSAKLPTKLMHDIFAIIHRHSLDVEKKKVG
jgi:chorismate mutase